MTDTGINSQAAPYASSPPIRAPGTSDSRIQMALTRATSVSRYAAMPAQTPATLPSVGNRSSRRVDGLVIAPPKGSLSEIYGGEPQSFALTADVRASSAFVPS